MNSAMLIPVVTVMSGVLLSGCTSNFGRSDSINYAYQYGGAIPAVASNYSMENAMTMKGGYNF